MHILVDKYIPFLQGVMDDFAEVCMVEPEQMTAAVVSDADALIIRTRTHCDAALLEGSRVRFIATATIGTDHIDLGWCASHGIHVVSCPGCNAQAVCDYIEEAIRYVTTQHTQASPSLPSIGIVGLGHVGHKVAKMARRHHLPIVMNDPPLGLTDDVTRCDIITFHTPLTKNQSNATWHLCDERFLQRCKPDALIINAARGGVIDEQALLNSTQPFILDTWENEPHINPAVVDKALLASYHIAGYSVQGKRNASQMCLDALCRFYRLPAHSVNNEPVLHGDNAPGWLQRISDELKAAPENFEELRKNYKLR